MTTVEIIFDNINKARLFMAWLSECGEQYYFDDVVDDACNSVSSFDYQWDHLRIITRGELKGCNNA